MRPGAGLEALLSPMAWPDPDLDMFGTGSEPRADFWSRDQTIPLDQRLLLLGLLTAYVNRTR